MPFNLVSHGWNKLEPGGTDYYMNYLGKNSICVECGQHADSKSIKRAKESIMTFLKIMGNIDDQNIEITAHKQRIVEVKYIYITKNNFTPVKNFYDFEPIKKGALIGTDGEGEITANSDGCVIFCKKYEGESKEAFLIGE